MVTVPILCILTSPILSRQVRGHLAAQVDPLNLNNMNREEAKKLIIRSVNIQEGDMDTVYQLPATTWIGGKVGRHRISCTRNLDCSLGLSLNGPDNGGGGFDTIEYGSMFIHSKNIRQAFVRPPPISYAFNGGEFSRISSRPVYDAFIFRKMGNFCEQRKRSLSHLKDFSVICSMCSHKRAHYSFPNVMHLSFILGTTIDSLFCTIILPSSRSLARSKNQQVSGK